MTKDRPPTYKPAPEPPTDPDLRKRYNEILAVLAGTQTVAGAARSLGMSRNHFQTILHRGIAAMIEAITPKPAGRPAKPEREAALEAENEELKAELQALEEHSAMIQRMMTVVGGIASARERLPRARSSKTKKQKTEDPEPEPERSPTHAQVTAMRD